MCSTSRKRNNYANKKKIPGCGCGIFVRSSTAGAFDKDPSLGLFLWLGLIDKTTRKWKLGQDPIFGPTSDFKVAERPDLVYQLLPSRQSVRIVVQFFVVLAPLKVVIT